MSVIFSPRFLSSGDQLETVLKRAAEYMLAATMVAMPLFFVPVAFVSLGFSKTFLVIAGVALALVFFCFYLLRSGTLRIVSPGLLGALWALTAIALLSSVLSGDMTDAVFGAMFEVHTVAFTATIALVFTAAVMILDRKTVLMYTLLAFILASFALLAWQAARLIFGPGFLPFGVFFSATDSMAGSFNDVALFCGLVLIVTMIVLQQLPARAYSFWFLAALSMLALFVAAVINLLLVWVIVGFFSLLLLLYTLTKDRLWARSVEAEEERSAPTSPLSLLLIGIIFAVSATFVVAGTHIGGILGAALEVQYIEVRPSLAATLDIMEASYRDGRAFLGIGPNRFTDAWRLYKDPVVSESIFWNTPFLSGSGYVPTAFVTLGLAGGLVLLAFLFGLFYKGAKMLLSPTRGDGMWYLLGTVSFAAAVYLWGVSFLYVPGPALLILAAFFSGATVACAAALALVPSASLSFLANRSRAFVLIAGVMVIVMITLIFLLITGRHFVAHLTHAAAVREAAAGAAAEAVDATLARAYAINEHPLYLAERVRVRLPLLGEMLAIADPTEDDRLRFEALSVETLELARLLVLADGSDPVWHGLLGSVYGVLAVAGVGEAGGLAEESLARAATLDPRNPEYLLLKAQMHARLGNVERARELVDASLRIKSNYVDALFLLSELDVRAGNTEAAIAAARSIILIEPRNPSRHFQLGVLLAANEEIPEAIVAFETAVSLEPNFANARYLLALAYLEDGRHDEALEQLAAVRETNPEHQALATLISELEAGETPSLTLEGIVPPFQERTGVVEVEGVTTVPRSPDTGPVVPVNRPPLPAADGAGAAGGDQNAPQDGEAIGGDEERLP
jgi:tetratricopeptide (TPR) repeat protein